jgi:uncharacterized protein with ParB-like and HNH nuclease domain
MTAQFIDVEDTTALVVTEESTDSEAYVEYDIASYPADLTVSVIEDMWKRGDIIIPDFQRNFVWDIKQSSLLIESFLLGLPIPQVFFYTDEENKNLVIDGQQRIMSTIFFLEGFFGEETTQGVRTVFRLTGLDEKSPFNNKKYEDLDESHQRKLRTAPLRAVIIRQMKPAKDSTSIYHIFERLNTGGTPLKPQEIRNCVFRGELITLLRDLNSLPEWRQIIGKKFLDKHQKDVELVLRLFALYKSIGSYAKPMKEHLNRCMKRERDATSPHAAEFTNVFRSSCKFIIENLGPKPFHVRGPLNSSVLDSVMCTVMENYNKLPTNFKERWALLLNNNIFQDATFYGTSDHQVVVARFAEASKVLIN